MKLAFSSVALFAALAPTAYAGTAAYGIVSYILSSSRHILAPH